MIIRCYLLALQTSGVFGIVLAVYSIFDSLTCSQQSAIIDKICFPTLRPAFEILFLS